MEILSHAGSWVAAIIIIAAILRSTIFTNQQQQEVLITRFGEHVRTVIDPGLKVKIPFIDIIAYRVGTDVQQAIETLETKTKDDLFVKLPIAVQFEVSDTGVFVFKNRDAKINMMKSVSASVRTATAIKDFQQLYTDRDELSIEVINHVKKQVSEFGINLRRIIIDEPTAPQEVQNAFNNVRASERLKEAARNKAEAERITAVTASEAAATAQANAGKGAADFRKAIFDGYKEQINTLTADGTIAREEAITVVMQTMALDAMRDVAKEGNLIIVPQNFNGADLAQVKILKSMVDDRK